MFEQQIDLSTGSIDVLSKADYFAHELNHSKIETDHLLYGLSDLDQPFFENLGFRSAMLKSGIRIAHPPIKHGFIGPLPYASSTLDALSHAQNQAMEQERLIVSPDLLEGVLRARQGRGWWLLKHMFSQDRGDVQRMLRIARVMSTAQSDTLNDYQRPSFRKSQY